VWQLAAAAFHRKLACDGPSSPRPPSQKLLQSGSERAGYQQAGSKLPGKFSGSKLPHSRKVREGLFFARYVVGDPEFSRLEAGAQRQLVDEELDAHGIHERSKPEAQRLDLEHGHIGPELANDIRQ
jgi:hypothetical protein